MNIRMSFAKIGLTGFLLSVSFVVFSCFDTVSVEEFLRVKAGEQIAPTFPNGNSPQLTEKVTVRWNAVPGATSYRLQIGSMVYDSDTGREQFEVQNVITTTESEISLWATSLYDDSRNSDYYYYSSPEVSDIDFKVSYFSDADQTWSSYGPTRSISVYNSLSISLNYFPPKDSVVSTGTAITQYFRIPAAFSKYPFIQIQLTDNSEARNVLFDSGVVSSAQRVPIPQLRPDQHYFWRAAYMETEEESPVYDYIGSFRYGIPVKESLISDFQVASDLLTFSTKDNGSVKVNEFNLKTGDLSAIDLPGSTECVAYASGHYYYSEQRTLFKHDPLSVDKTVPTFTLTDGENIVQLDEIDGHLLVVESDSYNSLSSSRVTQFHLVSPTNFHTATTRKVQGSVYIGACSDPSNSKLYLLSSRSYYYVTRFEYQKATGSISGDSFYKSFSNFGDSNGIHHSGNYLLSGGDVLYKDVTFPSPSIYLPRVVSAVSDGTFYVQVSYNSGKLKFAYYDALNPLLLTREEEVPLVLADTTKPKIHARIYGNEYVVVLVHQGYYFFIRHPRPDFCINQ